MYHAATRKLITAVAFQRHLGSSKFELTIDLATCWVSISIEPEAEFCIVQPKSAILKTALVKLACNAVQRQHVSNNLLFPAVSISADGLPCSFLWQTRKHSSKSACIPAVLCLAEKPWRGLYRKLQRVRQTQAGCLSFNSLLQRLRLSSLRKADKAFSEIAASL